SLERLPGLGPAASGDRLLVQSLGPLHAAAHGGRLAPAGAERLAVQLAQCPGPLPDQRTGPEGGWRRATAAGLRAIAAGQRGVGSDLPRRITDRRTRGRTAHRSVRGGSGCGADRAGMCRRSWNDTVCGTVGLPGGPAVVLARALGKLWPLAA